MNSLADGFGNISGFKPSHAARKLLVTRAGYRTERAYGENYRNAGAVFRHEVEELGNVDMLDELKIAFRLRRKPSVKEAVREIERRVGPNGKAIWLATRTGVRRYGPFHTAVEYGIPREAIMISDLGPDGQLFIMTDETYRRMGQP